jgi:hypothetical protein
MHKHLFDSNDYIKVDGQERPVAKSNYVFEGAKCKLCDTLICGKLFEEIGGSRTRFRCNLAQGHMGKCTNTFCGVTAP